MRSRNAVGAAAAVACLAGLAGCGPRGSDAEQPAPSQEFARVVNVEVERVEPRAFVQTLRLPGAAMALRDVVVSAEESGVVRELSRPKGTHLGAGDEIVRIDDVLLRAQVNAAAAQADYDREVWERRRRLFEIDSVGAEIDYFAARYNFESSAANLTALEARLERTRVAAPIGGTLEDHRVEVGALVGPGDELARIVQTDTMKVMAGAPERWSLSLPVGAAATVSFQAIPGEVFAGTVSYVGSVVDPDSRTFPIELELPNPAGRIKSGMIAEVSVVQDEIVSAMVVPQDALVAMEEGQVVYVVEGDGDEARAAIRPVEVSHSQRNQVVVESGLRYGDLLVVVGQQGLTDADRVRVVGGGPRPAVAAGDSVEDEQ